MRVKIFSPPGKSQKLYVLYLHALLQLPYDIAMTLLRISQSPDY